MKQFFKSVVVRVLTFEARLVLQRHKPKIVAVTGTVGKTTAKDAIYEMLAQFFYVRKSEKSFNTEIGVPLAILGLSNAWSNPFLWMRNLFAGAFIALCSREYPRWLVLEVGADAPGDIRRITHWLAPDVAVLTRLAEVPVHIEFFPSVEALVLEKGALVEALLPGGLLVLNGDDREVLFMKARAPGRRCLIFGSGESAAVRASHYAVFYDEEEGGGAPAGVTFRVNALGNSLPIRISGALGRQLMPPVLAAFAVGIGEGLNLARIAEAFCNFAPPPGRMRLIRGKRETCLIDDTYNASPVAMSEALQTLGELKTAGRKIAVLGDMLELGKYSDAEHERAGTLAASSCDILCTVGLRARQIAEGARASRMDASQILSYEESARAGAELEPMLERGDIVLVKGSARMRMEQIVYALMAEPECAKELLVRQEKEWTKRSCLAP